MNTILSSDLVFATGTLRVDMDGSAGGKPSSYIGNDVTDDSVSRRAYRRS